MDDPNEDEDLIDPDERRPMRLLDSLRQNDGELSDSDDEGEGGRRNHTSFRDKDRSENGTHKFGIGGGILTSGHSNTHGAGPSAHTTAVRILSTPGPIPDNMDVDTPPSNSGDANGSVPEPPRSESPKTQPPESIALSTTSGDESASKKPESTAEAAQQPQEAKTSLPEDASGEAATTESNKMAVDNTASGSENPPISTS